MKKLIRRLLNRFGYDIVKLPPVFKKEERDDLKKLFTRIYKENIWGGEKGEFYSGPGSDDFVGIEYAQIIRDYIIKNNIKSVVDIGCGDFRIASQFINNDIEYIGIDIVPSLIESNQEKYGNNHIKFLCLDATTQELPDGELCLIRQVLQHLSNAHIQSILNKVKKYKHLIISEHILLGDDVIPNMDMDPDWLTRIDHNSCILLDKPPFNLKEMTLLEVDPRHHNQPLSRIRTSLISFNG